MVNTSLVEYIKMADNSNVTEMNVVNKDPTTISSMQNIISESNMSDVLLVAGGKK